MVLSPKALRECWPQTPRQFHQLYVNGDFDPAGSEYESVAIRHGVDANRFGAVKVPYTETLGWEYIGALCRDLSFRTEWAQLPKNSDRIFSINFKALAAAEHLTVKNGTSFRWPTTFDDAVAYSRMRFRFVEVNATPASFSRRLTSSHVGSTRWKVGEINHVHELWIIPQVFLWLIA